ncbi:hypothetical protein I3843_Q037000 [Carya illinoinensis]|nr:hypothetical protein I3843_Q037000 [Carya illinoinensis]
MEISLRMSPKIATVVPVSKLQKTRSSRRKAYHEFNNTSCRSNGGGHAKRDLTNFYEVLSLRSDHRNVSFDEIKKAYRNLALQCHPDVCLDPSAKQESTKRLLSLGRLMRHFLIEFRENRKYSSQFSKEVWEKQLSGLKKRSQLRMENRTKKYVGHET